MAHFALRRGLLGPSAFRHMEFGTAAECLPLRLTVSVLLLAAFGFPLSLRCVCWVAVVLFGAPCSAQRYSALTRFGVRCGGVASYSLEYKSNILTAAHCSGYESNIVCRGLHLFSDIT